MGRNGVEGVEQGFCKLPSKKGLRSLVLIFKGTSAEIRNNFTPKKSLNLISNLWGAPKLTRFLQTYKCRLCRIRKLDFGLVAVLAKHHQVP